MDKYLLMGIMAKNGDTQQKLALALGISRACLNAKINETGGSQFRQSEIMFIKARYNLTADQVDSVFFNLEMS